MDLSKAAKRAAAKRVAPGYEGRFEIGSTIVDDPYEHGAKLSVAVNVRASGLDWLAARGVISVAQKKAGDAYRRLFERAEVGGARGVDYTAVRVDTSGVREPIDHAALDAAAALMRANRHLGKRGAAIAEAVCCMSGGMHRHFDAKTGYDKTYASRRTKEVLDDLVEYFCLA